MKHPKEYYKSLTANGYSWYRFADGLHYFAKHVIGRGYLQLRCPEAALENGVFAYMAQHNLTD